MRIVFCGSGEVAVPTLEALGQGSHEVAMVVTQPPRRAGRGGKMTPTPVGALAAAAGLKVAETANINAPEMVAAIGEARCELIVVVDFGQMVRKAVRESAPRGAINLHGSLLPALRGAAPIQWAVIGGLSRTGVTTFSLVDKMDAGAILLQEALDIGPEETAEELRVRVAALGASVVLRTVAGLAEGTLAPREQDHAAATPAPRLTKADGAIDFAAGASPVVNRIRGTWPWPGGHADFIGADGRAVRVIFARARVVGTPGAAGAAEAAGAPGTIAEDLTVNAPDGRVEIIELKVAGKRRMAWRDFVNGYRVAPGDRFALPAGGR